jgi:DNA-binding MarR family transcriptional regulator
VARRSAPSQPTPTDHHCIPRDSVDRLIADWRRVRPDRDFSSVAIVSRLERVWDHVDPELEALYAEHGLSGPNFAVLVTLARLNQPGGVSQRRLMDELGLTSGTVSVRMDRLVEQELVHRQVDPDDKRNSRITLTDQGKALFERIVPAHLANERRLLASLSEAEQELLSTLLRKLLVEYEGSLPPTESPLRLGMTLAAAHVTMAMRSAVGLPPVPGLLVRSVEPSGPAAQAGVRQGDVLVRASDYELRSVASLYAAIADPMSRGVLRVELVRGTARHAVDVALGSTAGKNALRLAETAGRARHDEHSV